ncbi:MAG: hypothetical protein F9B45_24565 [Phycisphaera sp. RhM]|nr:hypothetical protein [Phycisphaera sp. RhM]
MLDQLRGRYCEACRTGIDRAIAAKDGSRKPEDPVRRQAEEAVPVRGSSYWGHAIPYVCSCLGFISAIPVVITVVAMNLCEGLNCWERAEAGYESGLDTVLIMITVLSWVVFIVFPLPSLALSLMGFVMRRDRFTTLALLTAVLPIPAGILVLIALSKIQ